MSDVNLEAATERLGMDTGTIQKRGLDLELTWDDGVGFQLVAIRDGRDGVRGELTVAHHGRRLSWGAWALSSTTARESLRKKLESVKNGPPWGSRLEEAAHRFTYAARDGSPLITLTGQVPESPPAIVPHMLYAGEPTLLYADGDHGKSMLQHSLAVSVASGIALASLTPVAAYPVAFLDWETSVETIERRHALIAKGFGIPPPPIFYKRMTQPLVDAVGPLAAELASHGVRVVFLDSHMFAMGSSDGVAIHEPMTRYFAALRLFGPQTATLTTSHITNADARSGVPARPYGGAFAFNGPRLIWEGRRDPDADGLALALTCRKANNLPRRPDPFGLRFVFGPEQVTVEPWDLADAPGPVLTSAGLTYRLRLALASGAKTVDTLAAELDAGEGTIRKALHRGRRQAGRGYFVQIAESKPPLWALAAERQP